MVNILVIGAGIAGLTAARQLQSRGFQVTVLEGRNRIGGRIYADRTLGLPIDLGASWIHGIDGNPITQLAQDSKVRIQYTETQKIPVYGINGQMFPVEEIENFYNLYQQIIQQAKTLGKDIEQDISIAEAIKRIASKKQLPISQQNLLSFYLIFRGVEYGTDLENYSLSEWDEDDNFSGGDYLVVDSYETIIQQLAQNIDIQLQQKVIEVRYDSQGVTVQTECGKFSANAVIITLPLGVLKSGNVKFYPPLPDSKLAAINRLKMGVLNKVVLRFPQRFWSENHDIIGYISSRKPDFSHFLNLSRYIQEPVLVALTGGSFARSLESLSQPEIEEGVMRLLRAVHGNGIPNPEFLMITKWASDPFAFGSYSTMPVGSRRSDRSTLAEPVDNRLFFAGEATSREYPSTVHGAFLSGVREAKQIQSLFSSC